MKFLLRTTINCEFCDKKLDTNLEVSVNHKGTLKAEKIGIGAENKGWSGFRKDHPSSSFCNPFNTIFTCPEHYKNGLEQYEIMLRKYK